MNDERLLDCEFCGHKFFDIPDMALFGWDDTRPMYACQSCDAARQSVQADTRHAPDGEVAPDEVIPSPELIPERLRQERK